MIYFIEEKTKDSGGDATWIISNRGETFNSSAWFKWLWAHTRFWPKEQDKKSRDKPTHLWPPDLWQRRQEYTMKKRVSSVSGAGKTIDKNKPQMDKRPKCKAWNWLNECFNEPSIWARRGRAWRKRNCTRMASKASILAGEGISLRFLMIHIWNQRANMSKWRNDVCLFSVHEASNCVFFFFFFFCFQFHCFIKDSLPNYIQK